MDYKEPTVKLLKELKGKLQSFPDTEKDVEAINRHLTVLQVCPIPKEDDIGQLMIEIRAAHENHKILRRKLLKFVKDNIFYLKTGQQTQIKGITNAPTTLLIKYANDIRKQVKYKIGDK